MLCHTEAELLLFFVKSKLTVDVPLPNIISPEIGAMF